MSLVVLLFVCGEARNRRFVCLLRLLSSLLAGRNTVNFYQACDTGFHITASCVLIEKYRHRAPKPNCRVCNLHNEKKSIN